MNRLRPLRKVVSSVSAMAILAGTAAAVTINLLDFEITRNDNSVVPESIMQGYHAGVIDGSLFRRVDDVIDDASSGSGNFRNLFSVQSAGSATTELGYNRYVASMDSSIPGGFDAVVRVSELQTDNSGLFHVFTIDVNEPGNQDRYISMDRFQLYVGGSDDVDPLPSDIANLSNLGAKIYDMDANEDSEVLMDASLSTGSGTMDLFVFVPISRFAGLDPDSLVYVFTEFGQYSEASDSLDFGATSGAENIAAHAGYKDVEIGLGVEASSVPEPHSAVLAALGLGLVWLRRGRKSS